MSYVLFTAAGDTDPIRGGFDGPMLHIARKYRPCKIYLFLTAEMARKDEDTNCYELAIRHLDKECSVVKIPTDIKKASDFDAFHDKFSGIIDEIHKNDPDAEILLNISSGTPQIKTTMCLEAVSHHLPLTPIQVQHPENKTGRDTPHFDPYKDNLRDELENLLDSLEDAADRCEKPDILSFRKSMIKNQIKSLILNYDYKGAFDLIETNASMFHPDAALILRHAYERSKPNHKEAERLAREMNLYDALYPVRESSAGRACEYYLRMKLKSARGEIADLLLGVSPISEYLALDTLRDGGFSIEKAAVQPKDDNEGWRIIREKADKNMPGLMDHLDSLQKDRCYRASFINLKTFIDIMNFHNDNSGKIEQAIVNNFLFIYKYQDLRNTAAHDLRGITESDLKDNGLDSGSLCLALEKIIRDLYRSKVKYKIFSIYDDVNDLVIKALDKPFMP